ncbi:MAG TPA: type II toxin-antitoxin system RelE/ParE family toxin [Xanthobacteraceae bacterium]|jgi:toxin ParE1/3/4
MNRGVLGIRRSQKARADLGDIWLYIAERDVSAADRVLDEIERIISLIATQPRMGRKRPEIGVNIHSFRAMSWIVFYRIEEGFIDVVRVLHGARDLDEQDF